MAKKRKKISKKLQAEIDRYIEENTTSTIEHVGTYTIVADPKNRKESERIYQHNKALNRKRMDEYLENAQGRPIVRKSSSVGACSFLGTVIRETKHFYIYAKDAYMSKEPIESRPIKKIKKDNVHIEPCANCQDHPHTNYPTGSDR